MRGRFITLEGGEGVGKSTQGVMLADALEALGIAVERTREPGGSNGAEVIRALLMQGETERWSAHAEALLFAAARSDHVTRLIEPAIAAGRWVICDRFIDSTRAYQGAQGLNDDAILALHRFGSDGLLPDRTLLLSLAEEEGNARMRTRDGGAIDRFAKRNPAFHASVAEIFARIAVSEPDRVRTIDASGDINAVHERIMAAMMDMLP